MFSRKFVHANFIPFKSNSAELVRSFFELFKRQFNMKYKNFNFLLQHEIKIGLWVIFDIRNYDMDLFMLKMDRINVRGGTGKIWWHCHIISPGPTVIWKFGNGYIYLYFNICKRMYWDKVLSRKRTNSIHSNEHFIFP